MSERPILFSGEMVRALIAGRKTQTRRAVNPQPDVQDWQYIQPMHGRSPDGKAFGDPRQWRVVGEDYPDSKADDVWCRYGGPGDRLWVRETLKQHDGGAWYYAADDAPILLKRSDPRCSQMIAWAHHKDDAATCASIHMPRFASRITLELTDVRVQRLQDISEKDAKAEGIRSDIILETGDHPRLVCYVTEPDDGHAYVTAREAYAKLWDRINGDGAWDANPWVWCLSFPRRP